MCELKNTEILRKTYSNSTDLLAISLTHIPTGITVMGEGRSSYRVCKHLKLELTELVRLEKAYVGGKW